MHAASMPIAGQILNNHLADKIGRCWTSEGVFAVRFGVCHEGKSAYLRRLKDCIGANKTLIIAVHKRSYKQNFALPMITRSLAPGTCYLFQVVATGIHMIVLNTNYGAITIELDFDKAPKSSANFLQYAKSGFYDGTIFHRVINDFMIQGGGFESGMSQKKNGKPVANEADNGLLNVTGTLALARTSDPHSATSQFFINVSDNQFLNHRNKTAQGWGYAVFGKVTDGMDVVNKIKQCPTGTASGHKDVPVTEVMIESVDCSAAG